VVKLRQDESMEEADKLEVKEHADALKSWLINFSVGSAVVGAF